MGTGPNNLEIMLYASLAVAALVMLAVAFFLVKGTGSRNAMLSAVGIGCLVAGLSIGMLTMHFLHEAQPQPVASSSPPTGAGEGQRGARGEGEGGGQGRRGMGGGMPMGVGSGRFSVAKTQLPNLVTKLSLLTGKPLTLELNDEQKKQIGEQVKGLQDLEEISDDEAKKKLSALQDTLKDKKELLEALGYRWVNPDDPSGGMAGMMGAMGGGGPGMPGMGGMGGGMGGMGGGRGRAPEQPANPFTDEKNRKSLESLQEHLGLGKSPTPKAKAEGS